MQVHLVSGDAAPVVRDLAGRIGIAEWQAQVLPDEKAAFVARLQDQGRHVVMAGDGLNVTAALAAATVSISPATALHAARVASDIGLMGQDIAPVATALRVSRLAVRRMRQNFAISAGYNMVSVSMSMSMSVSVSLALVGLATPLPAAAAMSLSSVTVGLNALRLRP